MAGVSPTRPVIVWSAYDALKKAYSLAVISLGVPIVMDQHFGGQPGRAESIVAGSLLLGNVAVGLAAPALGRLADRMGATSLLPPLNAATALATAALGWALMERPFVAAGLFTISFIGFQLALALYDSLLARLAARGDRVALSTGAWAWGFTGSLAALSGIALLGGINAATFAPIAVTLAAAFMVFAFAFRSLDPPAAASRVPRVPCPGAAKWLLALTFIVYDGIDTLTLFVPLFMTREMGISTPSLLVLLFVMQAVAIPSTLAARGLSVRFGTSTVLQGTLLVWMGVCFGLAASSTYSGVLFIFAITGVVLGSSKALLRGALAEAVPPGRRAEIFGWSTTAMRASALIGPVLFSAVVTSSGSMRTAFSIHSVFFLAGIMGLTGYARGAVERAR